MDAKKFRDAAFAEKLYQTAASNVHDNDFSVHDLSRAMNISRMQLHRKVSQIFGQSTTGFMNQVKLEKAIHLMKFSERNLKMIAADTGFCNHSYFNKCFKEHYGCSPGEYRRRLEMPEMYSE